MFNGPVYRYDDKATDNAVRWPEYWDGRWFLNDYGNSSAKHALLLDPATAASGGQPVYADSFRGGLPWGANYMDSKFGPDGALYVQVYEGFFSTGSNAGLYKITYTGGSDTPGPDPQWKATTTAREVEFSLGATGGVLYEWDFGDGTPVSSAANPRHLYATAGTYTAKLTVTYADGEKASKTTSVTVGNDASAPTVTAQINGATPAGRYTAPVEFTVRATDGTGASGVEWIERRVDGGAWTRADNTGNVDPFETKFTVSGTGTHTVEFRARDKAGNVSDPVGSVTFAIDSPSGGGSCNPLSDQFNGSALDPKWQVVNPSASNPPTVGGGHLTMPLLRGDLYEDQGTAQTVLQAVPTGSWVATAKIAHANIGSDGEAAGLALINRLNPNHLLKTTIQYKGDTDPNTAGNQPGKWAERVLTSDNRAITLPPATVPWPNSGGLTLSGDYVWVRFVYDDAAKTVTTWSSTNGTTFTSFGAPISVTEYLSGAGGLRVGVFGKHDGSGDDSVQFDAFNVVSSSDPQTAGDNCGGSGCGPLSDQFAGTSVDPKWQTLNPVAGNRADGGRRPSDDADAPWRPVHVDGDVADAAAGRALGLVGRDREVQARDHQRGRQGGGSGADQQRQPEPPAQDDAPVQGRRRSEHGRQPAGQVGGAGADRQQRVGHPAAGDGAVAQLGRAEPDRRVRLRPLRL